MALENQLTRAWADFTITVHGVSAHGSTPNRGRDAVTAASAVIMALQAIVSRFSDPLDPLVVTVSSVRAGTQFNIIADTAVLKGTVYASDGTSRDSVRELLCRTAAAAAEAWGCSADLDYRSQGAEAGAEGA
ncbi:MAG: peptidase dimerization domain-containing protein [Fretibacterium sp.]|nr:peptidase dimerization domain-containing protein [Fretibacterium sp.]